MTASKFETVSILRDFVRWIPVGPVTADLIDRYSSEVLTECDSAVGHGPGHQSISPCIRTGFHTHHCNDMGHEWEDEDIGKQTAPLTRYTGPGHSPVTSVYRLAFEPY